MHLSPVRAMFNPYTFLYFMSTHFNISPWKYYFFTFICLNNYVGHLFQKYFCDIFHAAVLSAITVSKDHCIYIPYALYNMTESQSGLSTSKKNSALPWCWRATRENIWTVLLHVLFSRFRNIAKSDYSISFERAQLPLDAFLWNMLFELFFFFFFEIQVSLKSEVNEYYFKWRLFTFIISYWILLRMRNVSD
jgi:hypothetical protein